MICNFLLQISTISQVIKLIYQSGWFGKRSVYNFQIRIYFYEKAHEVEKVIIQLHLLKDTPNVSFKFISFPEICK